MSVSGYLGPVEPKVGIDRADGSRLVPEDLRQKDALTASQLARLDGESLPGGMVRRGHQDGTFETVEDYDPVLRSHCRL